MLDGKIVLAKVLAIYAKTGGKNGKHAWVNEASNIAAPSYLALKAFEHLSRQHFRPIPETLAHLQVSKFALSSPNSFLCALENVPKEFGGNLVILPADYKIFVSLRDSQTALLTAVQKLLSKKAESDTEDT
ncbi:hypothetical protein DENSPDRAFT_832388 [Dentipellis sp. KUC8613]|nr:hypothetical protein DENSPDRAFT_832388 [Dentipellis sp. KUC8613]